MSVQRGRIVAGGRLQVPADIRRLLGLADGDPVVMRVIDGELHVRPIRDALSRIQARLRDYVPADADLADELIADRRVEAASE
ncbi:MAG: AbrB/MazE/SpoVT family DNA-binding domain-containing protein [Sphingomonas sp.]|nr:MAG: AbrB/MazE/SpoVT family DNA-binding domain-containing protein [Sphingomonas sp.]